MNCSDSETEPTDYTFVVMNWVVSKWFGLNIAVCTAKYFWNMNVFLEMYQNYSMQVHNKYSGNISMLSLLFGALFKVDV